MSKAKMQAAKALIDEKEYDQARAILKTINHPTAKAWLDKLDKIAPAAKPRRYTASRTLVLLVAIVITVGGVLFALNRIDLQKRIDDAMITAQVNLKFMCDFGTSLSPVRCEEYTAQTLRQNPAWAIDIKFCGELYSPASKMESFASCIVRRGIPLP